MTQKLIVFSLVTFLHNLFNAVWIGGMLTLALSVMPAVKNSLGGSPQTRELLHSIQKKHSLWIYLSLSGLILTGVLLSQRSPGFAGLLSFTTPYSTALAVKHILTGGMVAITLYRSLILGRQQGGSPGAREKQSARLLILNIILGATVLFLSGMLSGLA